MQPCDSMNNHHLQILQNTWPHNADQQKCVFIELNFAVYGNTQTDYS